MNYNHQSKRGLQQAARALMKEEGIKYTTALRIVQNRAENMANDETPIAERNSHVQTFAASECRQDPEVHQD